MTGQEPQVTDAPLLQVVSGAPTEEELAALAAVVAVVRRGRGRPHAPVDSAIAGGWKSYWHLTRNRMLQGHAAWRSSARQ